MFVGSTETFPNSGGQPSLYQHIKKEKYNSDNYRGISLLNTGYTRFVQKVSGLEL